MTELEELQAIRALLEKLVISQDRKDLGSEKLEVTINDKS